MTMPALRPRFASPSGRDDGLGVFERQGGVPGILGLRAFDADGIGILPVPAVGRFGTGRGLREELAQLALVRYPSGRSLRFPNPDRGVVEHGAAIGPAGIRRGHGVDADAGLEVA